MQTPHERAMQPHEIKNLSDRELLEHTYRALYGEPPVHPGVARRVSRLETGQLVLGVVLAGLAGTQVLLPALGIQFP